MIAKISLALNLILLVAVIYLFSTLGANKSSYINANSENESAGMDLVDSDTSNADFSGSVRVAYVMGDSINEHYQYLQDKQDDLIKRNRKSDEKVRREMENAQGRYVELMQKAQTGGFASEAEAAAAENELQQMQMRIEQLQQDEADALARSERTMSIEFFERVQEFLSRYSEENNIDVVMNIQMGGSVLYGKDSFDVTSDVIKKLNEEYAAEVADKTAE